MVVAVMTPSEAMLECKTLLRQFAALRQGVAGQAPRDVYLQMAAVGIALTESYVLSDDDMMFLEDHREAYDPDLGLKWQSYWGLSLGYFLGKWRSGAINDHDLSYLLVVIPGFMFQHSPELCGD